MQQRGLNRPAGEGPPSNGQISPLPTEGFAIYVTSDNTSQQCSIYALHGKQCRSAKRALIACASRLWALVWVPRPATAADSRYDRYPQSSVRTSTTERFSGASALEEERRAAAQTKFTSSRKVESRLELPWNSDPGPHKNPGTLVAEETEMIQGLATAEPRNVLGDGSRDSRSVNNTERSFAAPQLEAKGL
jgi:hypothetical protein